MLQELNNMDHADNFPENLFLQKVVEELLPDGQTMFDLEIARRLFQAIWDYR